MLILFGFILPSTSLHIPPSSHPNHALQLVCPKTERDKGTEKIERDIELKRDKEENTKKRDREKEAERGR